MLVLGEVPRTGNSTHSKTTYFSRSELLTVREISGQHTFPQGTTPDRKAEAIGAGFVDFTRVNSAQGVIFHLAEKEIPLVSVRAVSETKRPDKATDYEIFPLERLPLTHTQ